MLAVTGLVASYGDSQVLFGVEFRVERAEVVTLLGRNGMGKTTTLSAVMGILPPRAGSAETLRSACGTARSTKT